MTEPMPVPETPADVVVPDIIVRALSGRFVPSARHYRMTDEQLAAAFGEPPEVGARIKAALAARRLHVLGDAEVKAGAANGEERRVFTGKLRLQQAANLMVNALCGES